MAGGGVRLFVPAAGVAAVSLLQRNVAVGARPDVVAMEMAALGTGKRITIFLHKNHLVNIILYSNY